MWLIDELEDGRVAVICKVHHAVLDGPSGVGSLAPFFDLEPHAPPVVVPPRPEPRSLTVADQARGRSEGACDGLAISRGRHPRVASMLVRAAQHVGDADLALPLTAPRLAFNRALTPRRTVEFTSVELSRLKEIRRAYGATLNDLLIAVCAGALAAVSHGSRRAPGSSARCRDPGLGAQPRRCGRREPVLDDVLCDPCAHRGPGGARRGDDPYRCRGQGVLRTERPRVVAVASRRCSRRRRSAPRCTSRRRFASRSGFRQSPT